MGAAREALEHLLGVLRPGWLAVDTPIEQNLGVAAHDRAPVGLREHRPRLAERVRDGIVLRLLVLRRDHVERDPELLEDLAPPRRRRG